jgi:hypothetical protein
MTGLTPGHLRVFRKVADFVNAQVLEELHLGLNLAVGSRNMTAKEPRLFCKHRECLPTTTTDDNRPRKAR